MNTHVPTPKDVARQLTVALRDWRNPQRAEGTQRYFKNQIQALGIETARVRQLTREKARTFRKAWDLEQAVELCDAMLREQEMEVRGAGILFLAEFRQKLSLRVLPSADTWLRTRLDNWALVDTFSSGVLSPLLEKEKDTLKTLRCWSREEGLWLRRAALVTLVPFARRGLLLDLSYQLAGEHLSDEEDLMHKATGWLLREAGKLNPDRLRTYLLEHGPDIPRTALRYAIERFPAQQRKELLAATRGRTHASPPPDTQALATG